MSRSGLVLLLGALALFIVHNSVLADGSPRSLIGIEGVQLHLKTEGMYGSTAGFDKDSIRTDIEGKLNLAGIRVSSSPELPQLYATICIIKDKNIYSALTSVDLKQNVLLAKNKEVVEASTWSSTSLTTGPNPEGVRQALEEHVKAFIKAYSSVNKR